EAISEAETLVERFEERWWYAELHRLRAVFLTALGTKDAQIDASFSEAIRIAREQKSVSLEKRAEATYAEYRRQQERGSAGRGLRLPLSYLIRLLGFVPQLIRESIRNSRPGCRILSTACFGRSRSR